LLLLVYADPNTSFCD